MYAFLVNHRVAIQVPADEAKGMYWYSGPPSDRVWGVSRVYFRVQDFEGKILICFPGLWVGWRGSGLGDENWV